MKLFKDLSQGDGLTHAVDPNHSPTRHCRALEGRCGAHAHHPNRIGINQFNGTHRDVTCPECYADLTGGKTR